MKPEAWVQSNLKPTQKKILCILCQRVCTLNREGGSTLSSTTWPRRDFHPIKALLSVLLQWDSTKQTPTLCTHLVCAKNSIVWKHTSKHEVCSRLRTCIYSHAQQVGNKKLEQAIIIPLSDRSHKMTKVKEYWEYLNMPKANNCISALLILWQTLAHIIWYTVCHLITHKLSDE